MKTLHSRHIEYSKSRTGTRRRGFTLIELMIVIAIAAILSALVLGGFYQITASNRRSGCQVNMSQIYNALRLYANDYDGAYPYYNETSTASATGISDGGNGGVAGLPVDTMGLWRLFTTQTPADKFNVSVTNPSFQFFATMTAAPGRKFVGNYLRSYKNLHCPNDVNSENLYLDANSTYNPKYLSYQTLDNGKEFFPASTLNTPTYQTQRTNVTTDADWDRQLLHYSGAAPVLEKRAPSDTVILWCKWHRTGLGGRQNDIVLFADGSVKTKPLNANSAAPAQPQPGWQRTP